MPVPSPDAEGESPTPLPYSSTDAAQLFQQLRVELRGIAGRIARKEVGRTMHPTALVNELYTKLSGERAYAWNDPLHFIKFAAKAMRSILLDHKRSKATQKRGGGVGHEPLDEVVEYLEARCGGDLLGVNEALQQLATEDSELADYVELRFFGGRTNTEASRALGYSERKGDKVWSFARRWLQHRLEP